MAASAISICSNALIELGAAPINTFTEDGAGPRLAANLYPQVREGILRAHAWNCAVKRVILAPVTGAPLFDYAFAFNVPVDCLKILQVGQYGAELDYRVESGQILADVSALHLRYIWKNENESTYDTMLVEALTAAMAARMAYAITGSASLAEAKKQDADFLLRQAKTIDGQDEPSLTWGNEHLRQARRSRMR